MYGEYFALPGDEEAEYLLAGLAKLIRQRGVETFVSAPLLLAEPRFFPDPVPVRAAGVSVLLRRLLSYAGLEPERLDIELYTDDAHGLVVHEGEANRDHVAAWFMEIADGVYRFGVREAELRDEQALIGTLGHEVAHATATTMGWWFRIALLRRRTRRALGRPARRRVLVTRS